MADSDNSTTVPAVTTGRKRWTVTARSADREPPHSTTLSDRAVSLAQAWTEAHAATAAQCLKQQQLETALLEPSSAEVVGGQPARRAGGSGDMRRAYADAKAAEALASVREQELLERLAGTPATSLAGIAAKLSVIAIEAEDNTDLADFPVSHVRSALEDLRRLIGGGTVDPYSASLDDRAEVGERDLCDARRQLIERES
jgi:hypothetical protein